MGRWLLRGEKPVLVIGWSDLKADRTWCLLRAAVPIGGRTLPLLDMVFAGSEQAGRGETLPAAVGCAAAGRSTSGPGHRRRLSYSMVSGGSGDGLGLGGTVAGNNAGQTSRSGGSQRGVGTVQRIASAFRRYTTGNAADAYRPKPVAGLSHCALSQDREGAQAHHLPWAHRLEQTQPAMCQTGTRAVVGRGLARTGTPESPATGHALQSPYADQSFVPRLEIVSLRSGL